MKIMILVLLFSTNVFALNHRYALIKDSKVVGVAIWDGDSQWSPSVEDKIELPPDSPVGPDWTCEICDGSDFEEPEN